MPLDALRRSLGRSVADFSDALCERVRTLGMHHLDAPPRSGDPLEVAAWYERHDGFDGFTDPLVQRLADTIVVLRHLVRDVEHTARVRATQPALALELRWITTFDERVVAAVSYTTRGALSCAGIDRVPYVYNVWSSLPGAGSQLLREVAHRASTRFVYLHPLNERVNRHYREVHEALAVH